jgi:hypothetical protein
MQRGGLDWQKARTIQAFTKPEGREAALNRLPCSGKNIDMFITMRELVLASGLDPSWVPARKESSAFSRGSIS